MSARQFYRHDRPLRRRPYWLLAGLGVVFVAAGVIGLWNRHHDRPFLTAPGIITPMASKPAAVQAGAGTVLGIESVRDFSETEAQAVSRQNYGASTPTITTGVKKITFRYRSLDLDGTPLTIYGRAYLPDNDTKKLPIFAFAPGTTGIDDRCAASLEQPAHINWGNYDSHMVTYASQGYAAVITDYEGMRDPTRLHHYMVGQLEGRAVLDSIRALEQLDLAKDRVDPATVFTAGYSQGGHAAFWADTVNASYAPDIKLTGVIGYGPVLSVQQSMNDITRGSILEWFGPYVLTSYADYYKHAYNTDQILQPRFNNNLGADVLAHCVDTDYSFWGHDPAAVYTPAYLTSIDNGTFAINYPELARDLQANATGTEPTASAKLINHGRFDNVVLPGQSQAALPTMCQQSKGPVALKIYPNATHFNTMVVSLTDTLNWMKSLRRGDKAISTCPAATQ